MRPGNPAPTVGAGTAVTVIAWETRSYLFCVPTHLILSSGAKVKKLPENRVTEKSKSSVELAGNAGPPGVGPPKQTKLPLPSHPPEFRPLGGPDAVKPAG